MNNIQTNQRFTKKSNKLRSAQVFQKFQTSLSVWQYQFNKDSTKYRIVVKSMTDFYNFRLNSIRQKRLITTKTFVAKIKHLVQFFFRLFYIIQRYKKKFNKYQISYKLSFFKLIKQNLIDTTNTTIIQNSTKYNIKITILTFYYKIFSLLFMLIIFQKTM